MNPVHWTFSAFLPVTSADSVWSAHRLTLRRQLAACRRGIKRGQASHLCLGIGSNSFAHLKPDCPLLAYHLFTK